MADISVLNTTADISGKTLVTAEGDRTITGMYTFSRGVGAPPFAAVAGSSVVTNLNADKVDGQDAPAGTIVGTSDVQTLTNKTLTSPIVNWTVVTVTDTGNQNNYAPGLVGDTIIRCNNASLLTITGLAGGYSGQRVRFVAINGQVDFAYSSGSSSVGNKFINLVSSANTSIAAGAGSGFAEYVYDATSTVWRLVIHEQGAWISGTPTYTGNGTLTYTTVTTSLCRYRLSGRQLTVAFAMSGTIGGSGTAIQFTLPGGFAPASTALTLGVFRASDAGGTISWGQIQGTGSVLQCYRDFTPSNWTGGTAIISGTHSFEVT